MVRVALYNLVGIQVDSSYPWLDTLSIAKWADSVNKDGYESCRAHIFIKKCEKLYLDDCRDIGSGKFISENAFIDMNFGVRIDRTDTHKITLSVTQECNEWVNICLQLLLVELNCTLIHAAALEKNGKVVLLPSWGGVGKTATVVRMIKEENWKLLGDDLVVLTENEVLPYLKPFVIYPYHRPLFPDVFKQNKRRIVSSLKLNDALGKAIPLVKKALRPVPMLLSFARKHNPQSMRVSPKQIFNKDQLSEGGKLDKVVWLERSMDSEINYVDKSPEQVASKTVSVTLLEIFSDRMDCVFAIYGAGIFDYQNIQVKMYDLVTKAFEKANCHQLNIPTIVPIKNVGGVVIEQVINKKNSIKESK